MAKELESDLTPEAQARVLQFLGIKAAKDLNLDVFPLSILTKP
jgi:hypothetical protein